MPDETQSSEKQFLEGRVAVVTGSGRGIGRAEATRLAAYGAKVVVNDLGVATDGTATSETPAEEVVGEIRAAGGEAVADASDISTACPPRRLRDRRLIPPADRRQRRARR